MLTIRQPATLLDMAAMSGARTPIYWQVAREMWREGQSWALDDDGQLAGIFGVYPFDGIAEAWFSIRPRYARHMLFVCRQVQLTLAGLDYPEIVVVCETEAGRRIARACGFLFVDHVDQREIWRHGKRVGRRRAEEGPGPAEATGGTTAASVFG